VEATTWLGETDSRVDLFEQCAHSRALQMMAAQSDPVRTSKHLGPGEKARKGSGWVVKKHREEIVLQAPRAAREDS